MWSKGSCYRTTISRHSHCSCPDSTRSKSQKICKHVLFIFLQLGLADSRLLYQRALTQVVTYHYFIFTSHDVLVIFLDTTQYSISTSRDVVFHNTPYELSRIFFQNELSQIMNVDSLKNIQVSLLSGVYSQPRNLPSNIAPPTLTQSRWYLQQVPTSCRVPKECQAKYSKKKCSVTRIAGSNFLYVVQYMHHWYLLHRFLDAHNDGNCDYS